ncbi:hypothetical protein AJ80_06094 [Polytolypa hystricis UAMH7299]|uniref:Uncharacterized protein n=1 Tax=Polytolypa hystricis (strain UAMH7299) TaxID=1447883 RepID=A0A2B7XYU2_POLH7|nr:hypothetical protein AJ80_06094 [Polytolypa hystricis UAMH7299]
MDSLTASEQRIFTLGMLCSTGGINNVDYNKLAQKAGLKNGASASVLFLKARRKILAANDLENGRGEGGAATADTPAAPKTPKANKGNKVTKSTPKSTPGKRKGKAAALANAMEEDKLKVEDTVQTPVKAEPKVKVEGEFGGFADEIIEGTLYPQDDIEWTHFKEAMWTLEAYLSEVESPTLAYA